jgi:hypothetical protein
VIELLEAAGCRVPTSLSEAQREDFAFRALANNCLVDAEERQRLLAAARVLLSNRDTDRLESCLSLLDSVLKKDSTVEPWVLILCQGGLVQEVVGLPSEAYEVCDIDGFEDSSLGDAVRYFRGLSASTQAYLRGSDWRHELPAPLQVPTETVNVTDAHDHDVSSWENEGGRPNGLHGE